MWVWRKSGLGGEERSLVKKVTRERLREGGRICEETWRREENYAALRKLAAPEKNKMRRGRRKS